VDHVATPQGNFSRQRDPVAAGVNIPQFVIIESEIGFHFGIFQKLIPRAFVILFFQIRQAEVEMNES
jgi:hypothetical protein